MNIKVPKFLEGEKLPDSYFQAPNPYVESPNSKYNLRAMVNYALKHNKEVVDLTKEEAESFLVKQH